VGVGVGGAAAQDLQLFVGPKDIELLKKVDPKLEQLVDFGWFSSCQTAVRMRELDARSHHQQLRMRSCWSRWPSTSCCCH
jgi:hypothetical protein